MATSNDQAIAITGCGWVTPLAVGSIADVLSAAGSGNSLAGDEPYHAVAAEQLTASGDVSKEIERDHGAWIAAAALAHACRDAGVELSALSGDRVGLVLGFGLAGQLGMIEFANEVRRQSPRFVSPIHFPQTVGNYIAGALARGYDIRGPNATFASGIASSLDALLEAGRVLGSRGADVVLAGGVDVLSDSFARGLAEPGVALAEGSCLFTLERLDDAENRGATVLATLDEDGAVQETRSREATPRERPGITSTAGFAEAGAVCIERVIGRCLGAAGASAAAAAIGAASGTMVPIVNGTGDAELTSLTEALARTPGDTIAATVLSREGSTPQRIVRLHIQSR